MIFLTGMNDIVIHDFKHIASMYKFCVIHIKLFTFKCIQSKTKSLQNYKFQSVPNPLSSGFLGTLFEGLAGDSRAFSSTVAVFSDTKTCLAIYLVGKFAGDFSTNKLTGSPETNA